MKNVYSNNSGEIENELNFLIQNGISLVLLLKHSGIAKKSIAKGITKCNGEKLLAIICPDECDPKRDFLCYYHLPGQPLRGFECTTRKKVKNYLGIVVPEEIFGIQRRKYPRVETVNNSTATFFLENKRRILQGIVKDTCIRGAKIKGEFPFRIKKGDLLTPLTLSLFEKLHNQQETAVHIPEASVAWSKGDENMTCEIGVQFVLSERDMGFLKQYMDVRTVEDVNTNE